ncbi:unnamed protein product, partial [Coffea canephora]
VEKKFSMVEEIIRLLSERERCLAYTNVNDSNAREVVSEMDLTLISMLGSLLISRPVNWTLSHQNALQLCVKHARLWLAKSDQPIGSNPYLTYSGLREKLNKIMASDYFTTTPEMKAPVEVAAAAGSYGSFQVPAHGSVMPVQVEGSVVQYQQKEEETANAEEDESYDNQLSPAEEFHQGETENYSELPVQNEPTTHQAQNLQEYEPKEQNYAPRRSYPNYRGGRTVGASGRRGYANGRGGRGRGGAYQNGRNQHYDQPGTYYPRNNYYRGRGGRGFNGNYNYHASQAGYVVADS